MVSPPTCYLHLSFLVHGAGLILLLVGYGTPSWTWVWTSSGEVYRLGLVVSCSQTACQLLHVTQARDVVVIVFCLSTACVLLVLFIAQLFCLSACNNSCRSRNMGIGLSYLSFLAAVMVAVNQVLYQIDLKGEDRPDVMSMKMGWSRYLVIVSSATFTVSALLSVADYLTRSSSRHPGLVKRWAVRDSIVNVIHDGRHAHGDTDTLEEMSGPNTTEAINDNSGDGRRFSQTVDMAMQAASVKQVLGRSVEEATSRHKNAQAKTCISVISGTSSSSSSTLKPHDGAHRQQRASRPTEARNKNGLAIVTNALQRYTMTNVGKIDAAGERQCLPTVEEEQVSYDKSQPKQGRQTLTRQVAIADDSCYAWDVDHGDRGRVPDNKSSTVAAHCAPPRRHVGVTEPRDLSLEQVPKCNNNGEKGRNGGYATSESQGRGRRNSAVEDALLSFNKMLDGTASDGRLSSKQGMQGHSQSLQAGIDDSSCALDDLSDCPPVGIWRTIRNEKSSICDREHQVLEQDARRRASDRGHQVLEQDARRQPSDRGHQVLEQDARRHTSDRGHQVLEQDARRRASDRGHQVLEQDARRQPSDRGHQVLEQDTRRPPSDFPESEQSHTTPQRERKGYISDRKGYISDRKGFISDRKGYISDRKEVPGQSSNSSRWSKLQEQISEGEMQRQIIREGLSRDLERRKVLITQ